MKNKAAQELGRLNKGVKKKLSEEQRQKLRDRLTELRKKRWDKKSKTPTDTD